MNNISYVGLDAHSTTSTTHAVDGDGDKMEQREHFRTTEQNLIKAVDQPADSVLVHLESSDISADIVELIEPHVEEVVVSDPRHNDWISSEGGGDLEDAQKLARLLRLEEYHEIYCETNLDRRVFTKTVKEYIRVRDDQVRLKQQIHALIREFGLQRRGLISLSGPEKWERILERVNRCDLKQLFRLRFEELQERLNKQQQVRKWMKQQASRFPVIGRYRDIPGCGNYCGSVFVAVIKNPFRFDKRQQIYKYGQLGITESTSNKKTKSPKKQDPAGHGVFKDAMNRIFHGAMRTKSDNGIKRFYRGSRKKTGSASHGRLNTMRKICDIMWSMWKHSTEYKDDQVKHPGS